jgi:hypothetical protein
MLGEHAAKITQALAALLVGVGLAAATACQHDDTAASGSGEDAGPIDSNPSPSGGDGGSVADAAATDGGDGSAASALHFATGVVSFTPGPCAGYGQNEMPAIVLGPPAGGGENKGSLDVVSLGTGGEIILSFTPEEIVDGPGTDFIVFENAFAISGNPDNIYAEPGEVSVSEDGVTWSTFPCTATSAPYGSCAGWHPVLASGASFDPATAGGDPFDLSAIGVSRAKLVRIRDKSQEACPVPGPNNNGFDLDAIVIVHPTP